MDYKLSDTVAARRRVHIHLVDEIDGITPETGLGGLVQPQISTNGGGFVNTANLITEIANGAYYVELTAAELGTLGHFMVRCKSAGTAEFQNEHGVKTDPYAGPGGSGTILFTWTELTSGAIPIGDVQIEFSTDVGKTNVVAVAYTDNFGQAVVLLDPGTYYVWRSKAGYAPTTPNPIVQVVS